MPTRFRRWQYERRIALGADFFVAGPVLDPATIAPNLERLERDPADPPLFLMVIPPFSPGWMRHMTSVGAVPATDDLMARIGEAEEADRRAVAWETALEMADVARDGGCAGVIVMGLRFETVVDEGAAVWRAARRAHP